MRGPTRDNTDWIAEARDEWVALGVVSYTGERPDLRPEDVRRIGRILRNLAHVAQLNEYCVAACEEIARWPAAGKAQQRARYALDQARMVTPSDVTRFTVGADLANALNSFIAFQNAGYLAGQPFEDTYAALVRDARTLLKAYYES